MFDSTWWVGSGQPTLSRLAVQHGSLTGCLDSRPAWSHRGQRRPAPTPGWGDLLEEGPLCAAFPGGGASRAVERRSEALDAPSLRRPGLWDWGHGVPPSRERAAPAWRRSRDRQPVCPSVPPSRPSPVGHEGRENCYPPRGWRGRHPSTSAARRVSTSDRYGSVSYSAPPRHGTSGSRRLAISRDGAVVHASSAASRRRTWPATGHVTASAAADATSRRSTYAPNSQNGCHSVA